MPQHGSEVIICILPVKETGDDGSLYSVLNHHDGPVEGREFKIGFKKVVLFIFILIMNYRLSAISNKVKNTVIELGKDSSDGVPHL